MTDKAAGVYGICLRGKAGWGENMAFLTATVQLVRRALVRREVAAAVQHAGMEGDARLLRRADEGRRASRRLVERLQREPGAVQRRQVRHVDRRHGRRRLRDRSEAVEGLPTRSASRSRPTTGSASTATGCGRGRWRCPPARARPTPRRSSSPGRPASTTPTSSPRRRAGRSVPPGTRTSLYKNPDYLKAAPFARDDA